MSDSQDGYLLPETPDAPRICFTVSVPNETNHIMAFFGQLAALGYWYNWERDNAHNGRLMAQTWRGIFQDVSDQLKSGNTSCDVGNLTERGFWYDMPGQIRITCVNGQGVLEYEVCPGEWVKVQNATGTPSPAQPGPDNSPTPPAPGSSQQYCYSLQANSPLLLPVLVNTGDTITLNSANGAGNDGSIVNFLRWFCPDGRQFFAGACVGVAYNDGADPVPTGGHMALIARIGSSYYPFVAGVVTVPSGVSSEQLWIQVNDATLSDNQGSYDVCVQVANNQAGTFVHTFDLTLSQYTFVPFVSGAGHNRSVFVPGQGFAAADPDFYGVVQFTLPTFPARVITQVDVGISQVFTGATKTVQVSVDSTNIGLTVSGTLLIFPVPVAGSGLSGTSLFINVEDDVTGGVPLWPGRVTKVIVHGNGTDPF